MMDAVMNDASSAGMTGLKMTVAYKAGGAVGANLGPSVVTSAVNQVVQGSFQQKAVDVVAQMALSPYYYPVGGLVGMGIVLVAPRAVKLLNTYVVKPTVDVATNYMRKKETLDFNGNIITEQVDNGKSEEAAYGLAEPLKCSAVTVPMESDGGEPPYGIELEKVDAVQDNQDHRKQEFKKLEQEFKGIVRKPGSIEQKFDKVDTFADQKMSHELRHQDIRDFEDRCDHSSLSTIGENEEVSFAPKTRVAPEQHGCSYASQLMTVLNPFRWFSTASA